MYNNKKNIWPTVAESLRVKHKLTTILRDFRQNIYKVVPRITDISENYKIPFWNTVSSPIEDWCKLWNDLDQRLPKSGVHRHGCDFKQNIYKVLPRIPGIPVNYKILFQRTTASSPLEAVCQIGNDSDQWLHGSWMHKHACDFRSKQNIFKVVPWIPEIPRNYYIPFQSTVSLP